MPARRIAGKLRGADRGPVPRVHGRRLAGSRRACALFPQPAHPDRNLHHAVGVESGPKASRHVSARGGRTPGGRAHHRARRRDGRRAGRAFPAEAPCPVPRRDAGGESVLRLRCRPRRAPGTRSSRGGHRCRAGDDRPDLVRTLQAQDIQRHHPSPRAGPGGNDTLSVQHIHPIHDDTDRARAEIPALRVPRQLGRDRLRQDNPCLLQGGDAQFPFRARPLRRRYHRHRRRQPRHHGHRARSKANLQHGRAVLRLAGHREGGRAGRSSASPSGHGGRAPGHHRRGQPVRHSRCRRRIRIRRQLPGQAARVLRDRWRAPRAHPRQGRLRKARAAR